MDPCQSRRRTLIASLLATALAPSALANSSNRPRVVGYLSSGQNGDALAKELDPLGFVRGKNLRIEVRVHQGSDARKLADAVSELIALGPHALVAFLDTRILALAAATRTIPIVCGLMSDPINLSLIHI